MSAMTKLRCKLGVWLLKPHWVPLLQHYSRMQLPTYNPNGLIECERCTYIVIGIKHTVEVPS